MSTIVKIGPEDHGRPMTDEEFHHGEYEEGYRYEIIDGRLYVSPIAELSENRVERWLYNKVQGYAEEHQAVINYVTTKGRVFVPKRPGLTIPEPDLAAYKGFPTEMPLRSLRWQDVSPLLVPEILRGDPDKDLVRNVKLFLQVPSIKEYWVLDIREDPDQPSLRVHRRHGKKWRFIDVPFGDTYTTNLLPAFELLVDPRS
jgi:Uma2 family endonuclease